MDVSHRALEMAASHLRLGRMPAMMKERIKLIQGSLTCRDKRLAGFIAASPQDNFHSYHVRFPDGMEAALRRQEFAIRKHHQAGALLKP